MNSVDCLGCGKELLNKLGHDFYGSYVGDKLVEGVCPTCHSKGIRTQESIRWTKARDNATV